MLSVNAKVQAVNLKDFQSLFSSKKEKSMQERVDEKARERKAEIETQDAETEELLEITNAEFETTIKKLRRVNE